MEAIGYVRVSTEEQSREGVSLDAQEERVRAYAALAGLELVRTFREEGVSGSVPLANRPQGAELVRQLRHGAKHVVAVKLDRAFRDTEDALRTVRAWDKAGVVLHLVDLGGSSLSTGSAVGKLMLTMLSAVAELERNLIAERTAAVLQHKRNRREVYGPTPLGYERDGMTLQPVSSELALVARMRAMHGDGMSLHAIAAKLNADGATGKRGGRWHAKTVRHVLRSALYV